jgi:BirA family transcriptional regulator, biotin operon repressor / biotin---[acetyl-CoA-carboxylase] ligase
MDLTSIEKALAGLPIPAIHYYPSTGSTNEDALLWSAQGAGNGALVIADQQTKGRGRQGRNWVTQAGASLAFSLILIPTQDEISHMTLFSPLGAVAVCQAVRENFPVKALVKWPNDVLVNQKKVSGILAETHWTNDHVDGLVLGIGINISPSSVPNKMSLRFPATCLESECGQPIDRLEFLRLVCRNLFMLRPMVYKPGFIKTWENLLAFKGDLVQVELSESRVEKGILEGIDEQGNLILTMVDGNQVAFRMGEVRLIPKT